MYQPSKQHAVYLIIALGLGVAASVAQPRSLSAKADTAGRRGMTSVVAQEDLFNLWGMDILISTGGFGLGTFYRREFTPDLYGFVSLSVAESKDDREIEQFDPYYQVSYVPGKLNRFMVLPLMVGVQYRLFREDIVDNFRPYVSAAVGPTMIYSMPAVHFVPQGGGISNVEQVEFFKSIGMGHPNYTVSAYIGFGANFGADKASVFGVNFRYYFTYLAGDGLPSLYNLNTGAVASTKNNFGGFFITLTVGMGY